MNNQNPYAGIMFSPMTEMFVAFADPDFLRSTYLGHYASISDAILARTAALNERQPTIQWWEE